ncbi:MAG: hypothetical protein AABZ08_07915 [Planctomycetota bacterium]
MWEKLKSATAVTLITVLIWITADQNVSEEQAYTIPLRVVSAVPSRYVAFTEPPYQLTLTFTAVGRRRHLKDLTDVLATKSIFDATIDESKESSANEQSISSRELLAAIKEVTQAPVRIRNIDPPSATIRIDEYNTVPDIRVACDVGDLKISGDPVPAKVSARLPRFAAKRLAADPVARADAEQRIRTAAKPDGSFQIKIPVTFEALKDLDPDMKVDILPAPEVTLTGRIEALTATRRKGPILINWSIPQQVQDEFRIIIETGTNLRPDIDVTGPKDLIDQLDPRDIRAFVDVLAADTETPSAQIRRPVQFVLPPSFALATGNPPYEIAFTLEPRATKIGTPSQ